MDADAIIAEILRNEQRKRDELVAAAGGLLTAAQVAGRLGTTVEDVGRRWRRRELLALRTDGEWRYPAVQFTAAGGTVEGLTEAVRATVALGPWGALRFLLAASDGLDGRTPLDALRADSALALRARRLLAELEDSYL